MGATRRSVGARLVRSLRRRGQAFRPHALPLAISVLATMAIYGMLSRQAACSRDLGAPGAASLDPLTSHVIVPGQLVVTLPAGR